MPVVLSVLSLAWSTIVFGRPLPGLLACYFAFCLLCRPAKLVSSGGRNGKFILKNGEHWESCSSGEQKISHV
jgi:hypothetical protein